MRKHARNALPSPALIVALVALVAAIGGGTAIAATQINGNSIKPKTVGGGKLKPFTAGLLKKETLGRGKIKPDNLRGPQIDESTLVGVGSADQLTASFNDKAAFGQSVELATVGPFTLTGQCVQNGTTEDGTAGRDIARVLISTSEANSVFTGDVDSLSGNAPDQYLQPGTAEGDRVALETWVATGNANYKRAGGVTAYAPSGAGLIVGTGDSAAAINQFGTGCVFQGSVSSL